MQEAFRTADEPAKLLSANSSEVVEPLFRRP